MEVRELPPELAVGRTHSQLSLWLVMPVSKRDAASKADPDIQMIFGWPLPKWEVLACLKVECLKYLEHSPKQ